MRKSFLLPVVITLLASFFFLTCEPDPQTTGGGSGGNAIDPGAGGSGYQLEYAATYNPTSNSYLTVYGWTRSPLVEFYIVESFGVYRPPGGAGLKGNVTIDGGIYDIYETPGGGPSIEGNNSTFRQYYSVRRREGRRTSGTVSITEHFEAWNKLGMNLGSMYEIALCVEAYGGKDERAHGTAAITKNILSINGIPLTGGGSNPGQLTNNRRDIFNGYHYEFWTDADQNHTGGIMNMTDTENGGTFSCTWDSNNATRRATDRQGGLTYNILFRMGRKF